jgi:phospholipase/carboxylesterase
MIVSVPGPHNGQPVLNSGVALAEARAAMIMVHGRGADAADILGLASEFDQGQVAYLAPQAAGYAWYPQRFIAPVAVNEPHLSSALAVLGALLERVAAAGIPAERTLLLGFSQGACLALEFAARNPQRYGGVAALSGALIENGDQQRAYDGSLADTPVFLGCSDVDFHIPVERVRRSTTVLRGLGADVTERIYPGMGHTVNADEIAHVQAMLRRVLE